MVNELSFAAQDAKGKDWRKHFGRRYAEIMAPVLECQERAAAEQQQTQQPVTPSKCAKVVDAERMAQRSKGERMRVATWIKNVLMPQRTKKNKKC